MFASNFIKLFSKLQSVNLVKHYNFSSALYITGDKAHDTFAVLYPHLDFEERLQNKANLESNLKLRKIDVNLDEIIKLWNFYKHIESKKNRLVESRISISQTIKKLSQNGEKHAEKLNTLMAHAKMVKEDLKILKEEIWSLEEKAAVRVLALPNTLHDKTPASDLNIIHSFLKQPDVTSKSHLEVAKNLDLIEYVNPYCYYLKNDASLFELCSTYYFTEKLNDKHYTLFSNSDFARSVIVEGCGLDFLDPATVFAINEEETEKHQNRRLHLTGSASLSSFMAYFCKHTVFPTQLPLRYFSIGKQYQPLKNDNHSLLNIAQESAINIFIATKNDEEMDREFDKIIQDFIEMYTSLNYHFRVCFLPANNLQNWESLRASFQLFSPYLNDYIEVGNISICGNYVSKRLLFNYGKGYDVNYPCVITGTLFSVPKLLACVLETDDYIKNGLLPEFLKKCIEN